MSGTAAGRRSSVLTVSAVVLVGVIVLALVGPWLAPHSPTQIVGRPYIGPDTSDGGLLGTDQLGRDVWSRVLAGGRSVVLTAFVTTLIGAALGALAGIGAALAGLRRGVWEGVIMRPLDAVLAVPPLLLVLLFLTSLPGRTAVIAAVVLVSLPLSARVVRAAAAPAVRRAHVEAATARGERLPWIVGRELLPFVAGPLIADAAIRFVLCVYLVAAAGFLGLGPDTADWGVQISEALPGAELQPWALAAPVVLVGLLGISANVLSDEMSRRTRSLLA